MKRWALALTLATGCAHAKNVEKGISAAQTGLAVVDVGTDKLASEYVAAVQALRAHCNGDAACEARFKVTDEDVARVTELAKKLAAGYDGAAELLKVMGEAWGEMLPAIIEAKARADELGK
jgi:hypothetical protein